MPIWKRGQMFVGRERDLDLAVSLVLEGMSIDLVGARGSGRTSFLESLRVRLEELGRVAVTVRGITSLRNQPLGALSVSGVIDSAVARGPGGIGDAAAALIAATGGRPGVFLIDDGEDIDDVSRGVIESARRRSGFPSVSSRPRGTVMAKNDPGYLIELGPLGFEHIQRVVQERLGGPVDIKTTAQIFSKSGGIVGLALSIVDIAVKEGRIGQSVDGRWEATGELWSSALRGIVETYLESLSPEALDAVNLLALIGVTDIETARSLVDWSTVERLEDIGLVQFSTNGTRQFLALTPPIIVDFVRNARRTARHLRLTDLILSRVGADHPLAIASADASSHVVSTATNSAVFSRMLQERIRAQVLVTGSRWRERPEPAEAEDYVRILMQSGAPHADIQCVYDGTDLGDTTDENVTALAVLRARWMAYARGDLATALTFIESTPDLDPERHDIFLAAEVVIRASLSELPLGLVERLQAARPVGSRARLAVWEALLYVAVIRGNFAEANRIFELIAAADPEHRRHTSWAIHAYSLVGEGRVADSLAISSQGMREAHGRLDLDSVRAYGSAAVLSHIFIGDYEAVDRTLDTLLSTGETYSMPRGYQISVLNVAAVVAFRRGDLELGERYVNEVAKLGALDGPLPGQDVSWSESRMFAAHGDIDRSADVLWSSAERLWDRGARYAAALAYISSLERVPSAERFAHARERIALVEGGFVRAAESYVHALVIEDADAMLVAAHTLQASGRTGYAIDAFRAAHRLFEASDRPDEAAQALGYEAALLNSRGGQSYAAATTVAAASSLSERERQVARLAADGMSNTEIATALVLSIRTVESHMYRVLRKLSLDSRTDLAGMRAQL